MSTEVTHRVGRRLTRISTAMAALTAVVAIGGAPASAGGNGNAWIGSSSDIPGRVDVQQRAGVSGTYHMDIWYASSGATYARTGDYSYNGGTKEFKYGPISDVRGQTLCTQLWYHKPGGGFESQGLPCHTY